MEIWVFANPDLPEDSLPLRILDFLKKKYKEFKFVTVDPLENWQLPPFLIILDTVAGIEHVKVFEALDDFETAPRLTTHDFDLFSELKFLQKLKKLPPFKIIGLPQKADLKTILTELEPIFNSISLSGSEKRSSCRDHKPG